MAKDKQLTPLPKTDDNPLGLEPQDGEAVTELGIEIPGAAGGFREPLDMDTTLLDMLAPVRKGDTIYVVMQLSKAKFRFQDAKSHDGLKRVDIFKVDGVAIVDGDSAESAIHEQRERVRRAIESAQGIIPMFDENGNPMTPDNGDGGDSEASAQ